MGADFIFEYIVIKEDINLLLLLDQLKDECKMLLLTDFTDVDKENIEEVYGLLLSEDTLDEVTLELTNTIEDTFDALENSREVSALAFKGYHIYMTGGMSWGDPPTEAFNLFDKFNRMPEYLLKFLDR